MIVPDLPFEEKDDIAQAAEKNRIYIIDLVTPTSGERIAKIASGSRGFLYCVSSVGVTGQRSSFSTDFKSFFEEIDRHSTAPAALGFGISSAEQVSALKGYCDAVIVGSAIVKLVEQYGSESACPVRNFVMDLRDALDCSL